jgi:multiple sugar transport system permease protein
MEINLKIISKVSVFILLGVLATAFFFPIYWLIVSALSSLTDLLTIDFSILPKSFSLFSFKALLRKPEFIRYIINSLFVASATTCITIVICSLGGYALARVKFFGNNLIGTLVLYTYVVPSVLLVIPIFVVITKFHLQNTYLSLIMAYTSFSIPFCMWLLRGYFVSIPHELEDAAMVDGTSRIGALFRIVIPLSLPGIAAAAMFSFVLSWNEFLFALVLINDEDMKTLPVGIASFWTNTITMEMWSYILASSVIAIIPVFIVFLFIQRYMIEGLAAGAIKG